ncbi:hypothetical protein [Sorangium sp. So ce1335]|uniref:hypothetical protein n=1 Tax=Sorangium sp. So ce1335 TaxID=3133335 RepID=UPI003F61EADD
MSLKHSLTVDDGRVRLWSGGVDARASRRMAGALVPSILTACQADVGDRPEGPEGPACNKQSMPSCSAGLAADQLTILRQWIMDGAPSPTNAH